MAVLMPAASADGCPLVPAGQAAHLREPSHAEEPVHGAAALVAVDGAELCPADGEVAVRVEAVVEERDVEGAVHGPDLILLVLHLHLHGVAQRWGAGEA